MYMRRAPFMDNSKTLFREDHIVCESSNRVTGIVPKRWRSASSQPHRKTLNILVTKVLTVLIYEWYSNLHILHTLKYVNQ